MVLEFKKLFRTSLVLLGCVIVMSLSVQKSSKFEIDKRYYQASDEFVTLLTTFIENTNSVMMQQLRMYTMFDDIGYTSNDPKRIQEMLVKVVPKRYKYFKMISYVNYETGLSYRDDGLVEDVNKEKWFQMMKEQRRVNKPLQLYYDVSKVGSKLIYPISKDAEPKDEEGLCYGFFVGYIPISYLQHYFNSLDNEEQLKDNFFILTNNAGQVLCSPKTNVFQISNNIYDDFKLDEELEEYITTFENFSKKKPKEAKNGKMIYNNKEYLVTACGLVGTNWILLKCTNTEYANHPMNGMKTWYSIICLLLFVIIFILLRNLFILEK